MKKKGNIRGMGKHFELVFCILQYGAYKDTIESIKSINKYCSNISRLIVVVDNCSPEKSMELLQEEVHDENVVFLKTESNVGFAKGNNFGIDYIKNNCDYDFIIVMNNDIQLIEDNLYYNICKEYKLSHFAVMGPMILTKDGRFVSNPLTSMMINKKQINKRITIEKIRLLLAYLPFVKSMYRMIKLFLFHKRITVSNGLSFLMRRENVLLHGAFLVFAPHYFEYYNDAFDPSTFLYCEENFLYKRLQDKKLKSVYLPDIHVYHKEDASTDSLFTNDRKKEIFIRKNTIVSLTKLLGLYS